MRIVKYSAVIVLLALTSGSCKKDALNTSGCDKLRKGLIAEDVNMVSNALSDELAIYTQENLKKLSVTISNKCNITASVACFDCIYTYPAQSELRVLINQSGTLIEKIIDISSTSANKMKIVNVHD